MKKHFLYGNYEHNMLGKIVEDNKYDYSDGVYDNITLDDKDSSHVEIIKLIRDNSTILDIGCANGLLGSLIKKFRKCSIDGIEYDKKAAKVAQSRAIYENVYAFSILDFDNRYFKKLLKTKKYDYIIFGDVLEHLTEPWDAIANVSRLLNENGEIIISLPSVDNYDIIRGLINGEFNYNTYGMLDTTHIRFFTASSFADMIQNISDCYGIYFNVELCSQTHYGVPYSIDDQFVELLKKNKDFENFFVMQNIFKITFSKDEKNHFLGFKNKKNNYDILCESINMLLNEKKELEAKLNQVLAECKKLNILCDEIVSCDKSLNLDEKNN